MININVPKLEQLKSVSILSSKIEFDKDVKKLWFEVPTKFSKFLITENLDAFLVGILFLALKNGQDIKLKAPVSAKLFYNLNHYVIPALCLANPILKPIKIFPSTLNEKDLNTGNTAGTGLSCGVDSFATYFDHIEEKGSFKIDYFAFFNAGSHGSGGKETTHLFQERFEKAKKFANSINKEIIKIDSNLSEILNMKFQSTNTLRNVSCVLIFQKLFKNYFIASKNRFDYYELHAYDTQDYDVLILNLLSTESTNFHSAVAQLTRVERTQLISNFPETFPFLDVCTSSKRYKNGVNCSQCNKCLRTALTLDLLNKLNLYQDVFHIEKYYQLKNSYIAHIVRTRKKDQINRHIYNLLKEKNAINYWDIVISKFKIGLKGRMK
ncbi:hypothetical protein V5739_14515 [Salinimicrobium sp. TIG7-5_MAKvit]|uniref:hypothetical protein n=1 Tax=Salinimicrobium sp. TIG7-5_MAKvit TaxID=3121289 RepID=UPI003C6E5892